MREDKRGNTSSFDAKTPLDQASTLFSVHHFISSALTSPYIRSCNPFKGHQRRGERIFDVGPVCIPLQQ